MLRKVVVIDGGFGSELERRGVLAAVPEDLNLTDGETVRSIHRAYAMADIITTNSFGLNRIKYRGKFSIKEVAEAAINNARAAGKQVFFDIGPTGGMMQPLGTLTFEEAFEAFSEIAACTKELVDGYIVETFSDLLELKACILALKEQTEKPIFATMTFDQSCRTLNGTTPEICAALLENLGVSALGVNCSLGPRELKPVVERFLSVSHLPVIVQPNRGIPTFEDGKTVYSLSVEDFMAPMEEFIQMGVSVVGGYFLELRNYLGNDSVAVNDHRLCAVYVRGHGQAQVYFRLRGKLLERGYERLYVGGEIGYLGDVYRLRVVRAELDYHNVGLVVQGLFVLLGRRIRKIARADCRCAAYAEIDDFVLVAENAPQLCWVRIVRTVFDSVAVGYAVAHAGDLCFRAERGNRRQRQQRSKKCPKKFLHIVLSAKTFVHLLPICNS